MSTAVRAEWWGRPLAETRWSLEAWRLLADPVFYGRDVPRGDGRAVLLLPGFLVGDQTLLMLATWLKRMGYDAHTAGFILNVDCADRAMSRAERVTAELYASSGRRVAVIGHSRGGHLARALGARRPDMVSHAVSLGADLQDLYGISRPTRMAVGMARQVARATQRTPTRTCFQRRCDCAFMQAYRAPFPDDVRLTSIYSRGDGVVDWRTSIVDEATCVEVTGSHVGLVFNRASYRVLGRALAEPELARARAA
jgi:pimeloyl-ACP methyl ester carboxylesterase